MKYFLTVKPRAAPPAQVLRAHKEWVREQEKSGRLEMSHCFAASAGGMALINGLTPEQINDMHFEAPAGPYCELELYPLVDFYQQMDRLLAQFERIGGNQ